MRRYKKWIDSASSSQVQDDIDQYCVLTCYSMFRCGLALIMSWFRRIVVRYGVTKAFGSRCWKPATTYPFDTRGSPFSTEDSLILRWTASGMGPRSNVGVALTTYHNMTLIGCLILEIHKIFFLVGDLLVPWHAVTLFGNDGWFLLICLSHGFGSCFPVPPGHVYYDFYTLMNCIFTKALQILLSSNPGSFKPLIES